MGSTNKTTNYGLSQFIASDKPAWLVDYNGDMEKIDEGMEENKQSAEGNSTKITQIETNLEQVTQTVQNQGTTLQEYGTTLTQHTTLIGQNSQNISQLQGSVDALEELVDERENDIWVFIAGTDGIGVKDGTWKTSWIGYAMEYINRPDTRVVVLTNQGAGMVQAGLSGQNFLGMLQNANIPNKNLVTRIYFGSIDADNFNTTNYPNYFLNFNTYCRNNFPNARVEFLGYWYNYTSPFKENLNTYKKPIEKYIPVLHHMSSAGIGYSDSFNNFCYMDTWFTNRTYNDNGQHEIGKMIAQYLITGSFGYYSTYNKYLNNNFIQIDTSIISQLSGGAYLQYVGKYLRMNVALNMTFIGNGTALPSEIKIGKFLAPEISGALNKPLLGRWVRAATNTQFHSEIYLLGDENRNVWLGMYGDEKPLNNETLFLTELSRVTDMP